MNKIEKSARFYVSGHRGMVGSAMVRLLQKEGFTHIITRTHSELDLTRQERVEEFFKKERPEYVFVAAGRVGGIIANRNSPTEFLYDNMMIASNVIHTAAKANVKKLLFLGSSCIFPKYAEQPIQESSILTGALEPTNEGYAIAKIAGIKLAEYFNRQHGRCFISAMPPNLYGIGDNYHLENSHVIPGLMRRLHEAKTNKNPVFTAWGTGSPLREFMMVDDLVEGCLFLMENYSAPDLVNVGSGEEISIRELVCLLADVVGYTGKIVFDTTKPDGTPRKLMDSSKIHAMGWRHRTSLKEGLKIAYNWYLSQSLVAA